LKAGYWHGNSVVEVLKNGGPIHTWDSQWTFGVRKAEMLIACVPFLREFAWSSDEAKVAFRRRVGENRATRLSVEIFVEMQPDFEYSTGQTIDRPWLCLQALPPDHLRIGLGEMKCRAICAVEKDLEVWLTGL